MTAMGDLAIRVAHLSKVFRVYSKPADMFWETVTGKPRHKQFWALRDVTFDVRRGQVVGLIGRNGAGKSTLLKIITGTLDKTEGVVEVQGRVSSILELGTGFNGEYTGRENVYLGGLMVGLTRQEVTRKLDWIIDFSELRDFIDQPFKTYSSGMQAQLTFATAACIDPDILIIDEALSVGDAHFQRKSFGKIREFRKAGRTILLVSHDVDTISTFCDHAILLDGGQVYEQGEPQHIGKVYYKMLFASDPAELDAVIRSKLPTEIVLDATRAVPEQGKAWRLDLSDAPVQGDSKEYPQGSLYTLCENGLPLQPSHSAHVYVRQYGKGAHSHWGRVLYFSTSDDSDPRENGRQYVLRRKDLVKPKDEAVSVAVSTETTETPEHVEIRRAALARLGLAQSTVPESVRAMRLGNRKVEILDAGILDAHGERVIRLESSKPYTFFFSAVFYQDIESWNVGFLIRNLKGVDVFGINSTGQKLVLPPKKCGEIATAQLPVTMWLTNGTYFLSFGVANPDAETDVQYDFRYDALQFEIQMKSGLHTNSMVNLEAQFYIE